MSRQLARLNRSGSPKKIPAGRKPSRFCGECGRTFSTRKRYIEYQVAHKAAVNLDVELERAESELKRMFANGEIRPGRARRENQEEDDG
jgi:hypothetical protein